MLAETVPTDRSVAYALRRQNEYVRRAAAWVEKHAARLAWHDPERHAVDALAIEPGHTVLVLGCVHGEVIIRLAAPRLGCRTVHVVDPSHFGLQQAARRNRWTVPHRSIQLHKADFEALPLPDASIDRVVTANTVRAWRHPALVIAELARVMRPTGLLCIYTAADAERRSPARGAKNALHASGPDDLATLFKARAGRSWAYPAPRASRVAGTVLLASPGGASD